MSRLDEVASVRGLRRRLGGVKMTWEDTMRRLDKLRRGSEPSDRPSYWAGDDDDVNDDFDEDSDDESLIGGDLEDEDEFVMSGGLHEPGISGDDDGSERYGLRVRRSHDDHDDGWDDDDGDADTIYDDDDDDSYERRNGERNYDEEKYEYGDGVRDMGRRSRSPGRNERERYTDEERDEHEYPGEDEDEDARLESRGRLRKRDQREVGYDPGSRTGEDFDTEKGRYERSRSRSRSRSPSRSPVRGGDTAVRPQAGQSRDTDPEETSSRPRPRYSFGGEEVTDLEAGPKFEPNHRTLKKGRSILGGA